MNICVLSVGPIFCEHVHGGSQRILRDILVGLSQDNSVTVLCVSRRDLSPFQINQNISVLPVLTYRETYPNPYDTSALQIVNIAAEVHKHIRNADVIYNHDAQMVFRTVADGVPSIISCRDLFYPETIVGLLVNQRDPIIVNSGYAESCVVSLLKRQGLLEKVRIVRIENGIDLNQFRPIDGVSKSEFFAKSLPEDAYLILSLGRPEGPKGHHEALEVLRYLSELPLKKAVYLGIPKYIDAPIDPSLAGYYTELEEYAEQLKVRDRLIFHDWVPYEQMPRLYSEANLVLGLGSYPECFGNTYLEAISCGTPCIVSDVGANRTIPTGNLVSRVAYGDNADAAKLAEEYLTGKRLLDTDKVRQIASKRYGRDRMVSAYVDAIHRTANIESIGKEYEIGNRSDTPIMICPWITIYGDRIFHDYEGEYFADFDLVRLADFISRQRPTMKACLEQNFSEKLLEKAYRLGIIDNGIITK